MILPCKRSAAGRIRAAKQVADPADIAEAKAAFHLRMRARGIHDTRVLRAFELVPRHAFVPHRYSDLAARDLALPIGCGQTMDEPWLVARMIEALDVQPTHRVLQIGAGSGYATAVLAQLAAEVIGLERYQSLARGAQTQIETLGIANAAVVWSDGLAPLPDLDDFDRILVHALVTQIPEGWAKPLAADGIIVAARPGAAGQGIARLQKTRDGFGETSVCPASFQTLFPGLAATL